MANTSKVNSVQNRINANFFKKANLDIKKNWVLYLIVLPVIVYYTLFCYKPMYGAIIAFKEYSPRLGILNSPWVGLKHFNEFLSSPYFWRILKNTLWISLNTLVFGFPAPIILAILLNEMKSKIFTRFVQTVSYLPHFISLVVVCSLIKEFTMDRGLINDLIALFGGQRATMLNKPDLFVSIYVISDIWQTIGWGSIIYFAALTGISQDQYEAAIIDGANRFQQIINVTIPGIMPTIIVMLILRLGGMMNVGFEKIILLYSPITYQSADVISSFVYRKGIQEFSYSYSSAVGLFNSAINCILLFTANVISKKYNNVSLW